LNFKSFEEAERVIINENYQEINGKEIRILWQVKDTKKINSNNVIVKNLPKNTSARDLQADFSIAGDIYSCKIPTYQNLSKKPDPNMIADTSYGFVCFFDEDDMQIAIDMFNNTE